MTEPKMAQKMPYVVNEEPGTRWWCACGHSAKQPYCDGAHQRLNAGIQPVKVEITEKKTIAWCGCKRSAKGPFCDGTHANI